jgi:hypothetical protein
MIHPRPCSPLPPWTKDNLEHEAIGVLDGIIVTKDLDYVYESITSPDVPGRLESLKVLHNTSQLLYQVDYGHDAYGRLNHVAGPGLPAGGVNYTFYPLDGHPQDGLLHEIKYMDDGTPGSPLVTTTLAYDNLARRSQVLNDRITSPAGTISKYEYDYTALNQRDWVTYSGEAFVETHSFDWGYNDRSELETAERYPGTATPPGTPYNMNGAFEYQYDSIGNRESYTKDTATKYYCANDLNQYKGIDTDTSP